VQPHAPAQSASAPVRQGQKQEDSCTGASLAREQPDRLLSSRAVSGMTGDASKRKIREWVRRGEFNSYASTERPFIPSAKPWSSLNG